MKYLIVLFIFIGLTDAFAKDSGREAISTLVEAIPKVPEVKKITKKAEEKLVMIIESHTFLDRDTAGVIFSSAVIATQGKVSTKPLKNFQIELFGKGILRPDVEYHFDDQDTKTIVTASWNW